MLKGASLLDGELWAEIPVPGYPRHEISSYGRLRSKDRVCKNSSSGFRLWRGRILKPSISGEYLGCNLERKGRLLLIHRLVAAAFIPNPLGKKFVNHKDGVKTNNRADNLEWVTRSENMKHAYGTGLLKPYDRRGQKHPNCVLTDDEVLDIRRRGGQGESIPQISRRFGIHVETVRKIIKRSTWTHL